MGHYETILFGLVGTIWDITRFFLGTNPLVEDGKLFFRGRYALFLSPLLLTWVVMFFEETCLRNASCHVFVPLC